MPNSKWLHLGLMIAALGCDPRGAELTERAGSNSDAIVGGATAVITKHPWQVSFQTSSGSHICGGSVIAPQWVLTAQHCTHRRPASSVRIVAGITKQSQSSSGQIRGISAIISYPGYTDASLGKDVSLLKLSSPVDLTGSNIKAIPLVTAADANAGLTNAGVLATVTGWGATSSGSSSLPDNLMQVSVPILSDADAKAAYGSTISPDQMAAGYMSTGGKDACHGDSGGPLVVKDSNGVWKLGGVVSWGDGCAAPNYPGMYARVSSFESWIAAQIGGAPTPTPTPTATSAPTPTLTPRPTPTPTSTPTPTPVPGPTPTPTPAPTLDGALTNGQTVTDLGAAAGVWLNYTLTVPEGASNLVVTTSGGTGDADLYVDFGSQPTSSSCVCRPYLTGNSETCTIASLQAGAYSISVYGYSAFAGVWLTASYSTSSSGYPGAELSITEVRQ